MKNGLWVAAVLALTAGCVTPGPHVRVAQMTRGQYESVKDANEVWFEFQPGDVVPFNLIFFGALVGGLDTPMAIHAKKPFFLISRKNLPMAISFDGRSYAGPWSMKAIIAVVPGDTDAPGGQVGWMTYLGESGDAEKELKELAEEADKSKVITQ